MAQFDLDVHAGASVLPGSGFAVARWTGVQLSDIAHAWNALFSTRFIADVLCADANDPAPSRAHAACFPLAPPELLRDAMRCALGLAPSDQSLAARLDVLGSQSRSYFAAGAHMAAAARDRGWVHHALWLGPYPTLLLGAGRFARLVPMNLLPSTNGLAVAAGTSKWVGRDVLRAHGLPVADGRPVDSAAAAARAARSIGYPVVLKRSRGGNSDGVIVGVANEAACRAAARKLLRGDSPILVERQHHGIELRLHFVAGRLHSAFQASPYVVHGDGRTPIGTLIARAHPDYWDVKRGLAWHRDRLVLATWAAGVRTFGDLERIVPRPGVIVRVSAASGANMSPVRIVRALPSRDRARLETFLATLGAPSAGIDVMVPRLGAGFDDGAVILEMNVPCGTGYLPDVEAVAALDLRAVADAIPGFARAGGRVPTWIVLDHDFARPSIRRAVRSAFARAFQGGVEVRAGHDAAAWPAALQQPSAGALLLIVPSELLSTQGIPAFLAPTWVVPTSVDAALRSAPDVAAMVVNAAGRVEALHGFAARGLTR